MSTDTDIFVLRNGVYTDISNVFDVIGTTTPTVTTDIYAKGVDIRNLYRVFPSVDLAAIKTEIYSTGKDLSETFAKKRPYITNANIETLDVANYYFLLFTTSTSNTGFETGFITLNGFTSTTTVNYVIIAGGGAGGAFASGNGGGGGGGAGGMLQGTLSSVNPGSRISVSVGNGGNRTNGIDSIITYNSGISITAKGGGRGGNGGNNEGGFNGGSGGGAGYNNTTNGSGGDRTAGQGNDGFNAVSNGGGGGGGAGGAPSSGKSGGSGKIKRLGRERTAERRKNEQTPSPQSTPRPLTPS